MKQAFSSFIDSPEWDFDTSCGNGSSESRLLSETAKAGIDNINRLVRRQRWKFEHCQDAINELSWVNRRKGDLFNSLKLTCEFMNIDYNNALKALKPMTKILERRIEQWKRQNRKPKPKRSKDNDKAFRN